MAQNTQSKPAKRSPGKKTKSQKTPWNILFWVVFIVAIFGLFIINSDKIRSTLQEVQFIKRTDPQPTTELDTQMTEGESTGALVLLPEVLQPGSRSSETPPSVVESNPATVPSRTDSPQQETPSTPVPSTGNPSANTNAAPSFRDRNLYLINVDRDGSVLRTRVARSLPVTDSPLTDVLTSLLAGPAPEERSRGLITLIPEGTRILGATVRGSTAYINFNEEFQFNTYGVEGYAGALIQVVWTATEFSNVTDVQILIEGRRVDYLGEGVWIGSPVSR
ncbi:MAG: GerMN domain-containing protein [Treponema sp.]|jgi:spore germination protein GerM|nr:GerMN domain-containing protein [Treponema sp.]